MNAWRLGALMIVVAVAAANLRHVAQAVPPPPADSPVAAADPVTRQERRLAALHQELKTRGLQGPVGYVDEPTDRRQPKDLRAVEDYYLTQFVLAPLVLDPDAARHDWAVANLRSDIPARAPDGWRIEQDFGGGVLLLRKALP
jgi:hypothetical protein